MTPRGPAPAVLAPQNTTTHATAVQCPRPPPPTNGTVPPIPRATDTHLPPPAPATAAPAPPSASTRATAVPCPQPPPPTNSTALPVHRSADTHPPPPAPATAAPGPQARSPPPPPCPRPPRLVVSPRPAGAPPLGEVGRGSGKACGGAHDPHLRGDPRPHPRQPQQDHP